MPRLTCPRCSRVFNYTGKRTSPPCPRCEYHVGVGGSPTARELNDDGDEVESDEATGETTQTTLVTAGGPGGQS